MNGYVRGSQTRLLEHTTCISGGTKRAHALALGGERGFAQVETPADCRGAEDSARRRVCRLGQFDFWMARSRRTMLIRADRRSVYDLRRFVMITRACVRVKGDMGNWFLNKMSG